MVTVPLKALGPELSTLPNWSSALTVTAPGVPAMTGLENPLTTNCAAAAGLTVMFDWLPVMLPLVAVIDCVPAVLSVTLKLPVPLLRAAGLGRVAWLSLLVMVTVPLKAFGPELSTLPNWSSALTVTAPGVPAMTGLGNLLTTNCVAAAGLT